MLDVPSMEGLGLDVLLQSTGNDADWSSIGPPPYLSDKTTIATAPMREATKLSSVTLGLRGS